MEKKQIQRKEAMPALKQRKAIKKTKPKFPRQEAFKHKKISESWRRPRGRHSKLRKGEKARGSVPSIGYSSPTSVRGLDRFGYREVRISNENDLESIKKTHEVVVISGAVGKRKREIIAKAAEAKKIRVKNF